MIFEEENKIFLENWRHAPKLNLNKIRNYGGFSSTQKQDKIQAIDLISSI